MKFFKILHFVFFAALVASCGNSRKIEGNSFMKVKQKGTIVSIGEDLFFINELFDNEEDIARFIRLNRFPVEKIDRKMDRDFPLLQRAAMDSISSQYYECGLGLGSNELKYLRADVTFIYNKMTFQWDFDNNNNISDICIYKWAIDSAYYLKYHSCKNTLYNVSRLK